MADAPSACAYVRESGRGRARAEPGRPPRAPALAASPGARAAPPPPPAARAPRGVGGGAGRRAGSEAPGSGGAGAPAPARVPRRLAPRVPAREAGELQTLESARKSARGGEPAGPPVSPWLAGDSGAPPGDAKAGGLWGEGSGAAGSPGLWPVGPPGRAPQEQRLWGVGLKEEAGRGRHV